MTHDEVDFLIREPLLQCRSSAIDILKNHGWLLIPDARVEPLTSRSQGVFHGVRLDEATDADFAVYEELQGRLHWQFVLVSSPSARILEGSQTSREFQNSLEQIDCWRQLVRQNGIPDHLTLPRYEGLSAFVTYRIIIGQSRQQTPEEKATVQQYRGKNLRIRSYNWLLEKPDTQREK